MIEMNNVHKLMCDKAEYSRCGCLPQGCFPIPGGIVRVFGRRPSEHPSCDDDIPTPQTFNGLETPSNA